EPAPGGIDARGRGLPPFNDAQRVQALRLLEALQVQAETDQSLLVIEAFGIRLDSKLGHLLCRKDQDILLPATITEEFGYIGELVIFAHPGMNQVATPIGQEREDTFFRFAAHRASPAI